MKKVVAAVKSVNVRVSKDAWEAVGSKPAKGDRVNLELKGRVGGRLTFVNVYMTPQEFNALKLTKVSSKVAVLFDDDDLECEDRYDYAKLNYGDVNLVVKHEEIDPDFAEFDYEFGEVEAVKADTSNRDI